MRKRSGEEEFFIEPEGDLRGKDKDNNAERVLSLDNLRNGMNKWGYKLRKG